MPCKDIKHIALECRKFAKRTESESSTYIQFRKTVKPIERESIK